MYATLIQELEECLAKLGLNPQEAKVGEGQYNISKDQYTEVLLDLWEENGCVFLQVLSPVTKLKDTSRSEVLKMLLEENHGLVDVAFALVKEDIVLKHTIECTGGLMQTSLFSLLARLAHYSETYRTKWQTLSESV